MSSRPYLKPFKVVTDGDMSDDIVSKPTIISNVSMISYDVSWTGTSPVGTVSVEISNTYSENVDGSVRDAGNWTALPLGGSVAVSGDSDSGAIDIDASGFNAVRFKYTSTSGVGTMNVTVSGKVS